MNKKDRKRLSSKYCILNEGMGSGKTLQAICMCVSYAVQKLFYKNSNKTPADAITLKDIYKTPELLKYRNIVLCPGHLVEKWAREIKEQVPFAKVTVLRDMSQIVELRSRGRERHNQEWYVIGKDFAKLSYMCKPTPNRIGYGKIYRRTCAACYDAAHDEEVVVTGKSCPKCHGTRYRFFPLDETVKGLMCPKCSKILIPYEKRRDENSLKSLTPFDFTAPKAINERCIYCNEELWTPCVTNINTSGETKVKKREWIRITHYRNKAHNGKETVWMLNTHKEAYLKSIGEVALNEITGDGIRRVAPATYIKKHLKGFFDVAVFDEMHLYKSGASAQGNVMHALIRVSERQLGLTGTIAGGYAEDLFYNLFKLDPRRMRERGFNWQSSSKFTEIYGNIETVVPLEEVTGKMHKGRSYERVSKKPGISPMVFLDFLLDRTVFLDISDMSKYIPSLTETVVTVPVDDEIRASANEVITALKSEHKLGMMILGTMFQFSLSYYDHPYGYNEIIDPTDAGRVIVNPESFDKYRHIECLLPKERALLDIISREIEEGRNIFVYAEYTSSAETKVTDRIRDIILHHTKLKDSEVAILNSSSPAASEREAWIKKKACDGVKVVITNPKCVETGLDFCFHEKNRYYSFPTLIYFQCGMRLDTLWQSSRRAMRLNQTMDCRTYYMAYENTAQQAALSIMARKMTATSAIQGKFSGEGLQALSQGIDAQVELAKAMQSKDLGMLTNDIQAMFDCKADAEEDVAFKDVPRMKLYEEIVGKKYHVDTEPDEDVPETIILPAYTPEPVSAPSIFDFFGLSGLKDEAPKPEYLEEEIHEYVNRVSGHTPETYTLFDFFRENENGTQPARKVRATSKPKGKTKNLSKYTLINSQMSFF